MSYSKIVLPVGAELPIRTAAHELANETGASVGRSFGGRVQDGEIVLVTGDGAGIYPEVKAVFDGRLPGGEWEAVVESGGGLVIAGSSARNVCHAVLAWIDDPALETGRAARIPYGERWTMWDNTLNQWYRGTNGFDRESHIRELARMGHTGVEINRYPDAGGGWHVRNRKFPGDSYAWYVSYAPALDAFVESSLTEGIYPREELERNRADLLQAAELVRSYGMKPGFVCYEPRCVSEKVFDRYPELRGSRTDHPGRSLEPRYAMDIANPRVLEHYREMVSNLIRLVPDLRYLVFWTSDSGSGLPFAKSLYFGPNGSYIARSKKLEQMAAEFSGSMLTAGRKLNPEFDVLMEISWEYTRDERERITKALPNDVSLSHSLMGGAGILGGTDPENSREVYDFDRKVGKKFWSEFVVSLFWDIEPVFGICFPTLLQRKFASLDALDVKQFFTLGGICSPPQCPYMVNHEVYLELVRGNAIPNMHEFLTGKARLWCDGNERAAEMLVKAWLSGERALESWPILNWYHRGPAATQGRWITRPLVPDFSLLTGQEKRAFSRSVFTLEADVARINLAFEGGIRMYDEEEFERAAKSYDDAMLPQLELTVSVLDQAIEQSALPALIDQRDRYKGLLLLQRTLRNSMAAQAAINRWLLGQGNREQKRAILKQAIEAEITNTSDWISLLKSSTTNFFHLAQGEETPFIYKTPIEDLELRLEVMKRHCGDAPGPDLVELSWKNDESTAYD
jgi:hypothetical protein